MNFTILKATSCIKNGPAFKDLQIQACKTFIALTTDGRISTVKAVIMPSSVFQDRVRRVPQRPRVLRHQPQDGRQLGQAARNGGNVPEAEAGSGSTLAIVFFQH